MNFTDMLINQPAEGGGWIKPRDMMGHLVAILKVHEISAEPDNMNKGEMRDVARVDLVDLDDGKGGELQERVRIDKKGIVNKLAVAQLGVTLGRIGTVPTASGNNAFVLPPFIPGQADVRLRTWASSRNSTPAPAPAAVPAPTPIVAAPTSGPDIRIVGGVPIDLNTLDEATRNLVMSAQQQAS